MLEEYSKLHQEILNWIAHTTQRLATENRCQHASRNFGEFSIVIMASYSIYDGRLEVTVYQLDTKQIQDQLSGAVPILFEEGW